MGFRESEDVPEKPDASSEHEVPPIPITPTKPANPQPPGMSPQPPGISPQPLGISDSTAVDTYVPFPVQTTSQRKDKEKVGTLVPATTPHLISFGYQATRVSPGLPAHLGGVIPFFDFFMEMDGRRMELDNSWFRDYLLENAEKGITFKIYNTRNRQVREVVIRPDLNAERKAGLLGCSLSWASVHESYHSSRKIYHVRASSGAAVAGLVPSRDYIIGMQPYDDRKGELKAYCVALTPEDSYESRLRYSASLERCSSLKLMVYDSDDFTIREVAVQVPLGMTPLGGIGNSIPHGPELPTLAKIIGRKYAPDVRESHIDGLANLEELLAETTFIAPSNTRAKAVRKVDSYFNAIRTASSFRKLDPMDYDRKGARMSKKIYRRLACFLMALSLSVGAYFTTVGFVKIDWDESEKRRCSEPLAVWSIVNGIFWLLFGPMSIVALAIVGNLCGQNCPSVILTVCSVPTILFLVVWWIVGNVWVFKTDIHNCDQFLYRSCLIWIVLMYVIIGLALVVPVVKRLIREDQKRKQKKIWKPDRDGMQMPRDPFENIPLESP